MSSMQAAFVSHALSRLYRGVCLCCWLVGLSLTAQLLIWATATFMDVRYRVLEQNVPTGQIVSGTENKITAPPANAETHHAAEPEAATDRKSIDVNKIRTSNDRMMAVIAASAMSTGTLAMIILLPLLALGVLLGANSATPGVEQTVAAFMWSILVAILVLPVGQHIGLPWNEGALATYSYMTGEVDRELTDAASWGSISFYCRFALLPLACIVGITLIGLSFAAGVASGILPKEDMRLDPVLEKEAANIKATSLHGGRAVSALRGAGAPAALAEKKPIPAINQVSAGEAPRRLI